MQENHAAFIAMDRCRNDSLGAAGTASIDRSGKAGKRYSPASWNAPQQPA